MKLMVCIIFSLLIATIIYENRSDASIWIKNVKSYGSASINAGTECLATMSKYYFQDPSLPRAQNLVMSYTRNITVPAAKIQQMYLNWVHESIANGEFPDIRLQLISGVGSIEKIRNIPTNAIYEIDYYTLVMDNINNFNAIMRGYITRASFNPGAKFLILFNNPDSHRENNTEKNLAFHMFRLMYEKYNAANVIFLYATDIDTYNVYVTNPYFDQSQCGSLQPILLDTCKNGKLKNDVTTKIWSMRSKVPKTLPNCTFKFCARVTQPYVYEGCKSGLELQIVSVLEEKLGFNITMLCLNMDRGEPFRNGSWSGILGMLRNDQCDFVLGGFFPDDDVHDDFGVTKTYLEDTYTWYVFVAARQPQWLGLITIFKYYTWIVICLLFVLSVMSWYFFGRITSERSAHRNIALCFLNSWSMLLGISANNRPEWSPLRVFFVISALYALNLTTVYTSKLINVFTQPAYEDQIDTIEEIVDSKLPIGGREDYRDWFNNDNPDDQILFKMYQTTKDFWSTYENLQSVSDGHRIILMNRIFVQSASIQSVFPFSGNVIVNPLEMISERGFPLLKRFTELIMYMTDSGIIMKLYNDFIYDSTILANIRDRRNIKEETQIVLTLGHMDGAFTVLLLGLFISGIVFMFELLIHWHIRRKKKENLWQIFRKRMRQAMVVNLLKKKATKVKKAKKRHQVIQVKMRNEIKTPLK